jgi:hypothetical protein
MSILNIESPKISIFASSVRPHLWKFFFSSIQQNDLPFEVVFTGNLPDDMVRAFAPKANEFKAGQIFRYIPVGNIKPAQAYEIACRNCEGELIHWTADDAEYSPHLLDEVWKVWEKTENKRTIISCQTIEDGNFVHLEHHRLFGRAFNTPQMAPLGFMSREFYNELGGIDRRYVSGQWDNDIIMRALNVGAEVVQFVERGQVSLHHRNKHGGNAGTFRGGYKHDRTILEGAWAPEGRDQNIGSAPFKRFDGGFEPFDRDTPDFYFKSQSHKGIWE